MSAFATARRSMVDSQVRPSDVTDLRLIAAMLELPRERFVPPAKADLAYLDLDVPVVVAPPGAPVRRLLKPMVLAKLIQAAEVTESARVLDVGCATGYSSALLARLADHVVALEAEPELVELARAALAATATTRVSLVTYPLAEGWPADAPYDVIVINGAVEVMPEALLGQLKDGGRLVCVRRGAPAGQAMLYRRFGTEVSGRPIFDATAPLLPGFSRPAAFVF
jgi:protein-L-isoaspartate(D-aspartate) O-methyltransferase